MALVRFIFIQNYVIFQTNIIKLYFFGKKNYNANVNRLLPTLTLFKKLPVQKDTLFKTPIWRICIPCLRLKTLKTIPV